MTTADEITKLAQLKEQGALTEEEFEQQKQALLAQSQQVRPPGSRRALNPEQAQKVKKLLLWSRILGWGGIGMLFVVAPVLGIGLHSGGGAAAAAVLGIAAAITGAVLGQIGRGMQGRAI